MIDTASVRVPWLSLLLSAVCPFVVYQLLTLQGVPTVEALAVAMVFPGIDTILGWVRRGRPDPLGLLSLFFLGVSIAVALLTEEPLVVLLRPSVTGAALGLLCFASLLLRRPAIFYIARQFATSGNSVATERFDKLWAQPNFRSSMRLLTVVWGCWLLGAAAARTALALTLTVSTFLAIWPIIHNVGIIGLIAWSISYGRRSIPEQPAIAGG